jgi:hypothetical protein
MLNLESATDILPDSVRLYDWGAGNSMVPMPSTGTSMMGIETIEVPRKIIVFEVSGNETEEQLIDLLKSKSEELLAQS